MTDLYRMHDRDGGPMLPVAPSEAERWNERGFGIFVPVNVFDGARRIENLARIRAWAIDMDAGSKREQADRIRQSPLEPSAIVESKRGYHVWFFASEATRETWSAIVADRLVPYFGADPRAKDLARVLRAPGYLHLKDPDDPFLVREVARSGRRYTEGDMLEAFPDVGGERRRKREERAKPRPAERPPQGGDLWERAFQLDCRYALERLSGHPAVGGEEFTFRRVSSGNLNIIVDGKGTSCFVDAEGKIGSHDKGGPGIAQWIRWYGYSWRDVARILREVFPELEEDAA